MSPPHRVIHKASSTSILIVMYKSGEAEGTGEILVVPQPASAPPAVGNFEDTSGKVGEDEYREVIEHPEGTSKLEELRTEGPEGVIIRILEFIAVAYCITMQPLIQQPP